MVFFRKVYIFVPGSKLLKAFFKEKKNDFIDFVATKVFHEKIIKEKK